MTHLSNPGVKRGPPTGAPGPKKLVHGAEKDSDGPFHVFCVLLSVGVAFFFQGNVYQYISPVPGYLSDVSFSFVLMKLLLVIYWY